LRREQNLPGQAETAFRKAVKLSPNYATAWQWYAGFIARDPLRRDKALELLTKAAELDPRSSIISMNLATHYKNTGLYSLAERQYLKVIELNPEFIPAYRQLINFYNLELSRFDQAFIYAQKVRAANPGQARSLWPLADIYLNLGDLTAAENILKQMMELDASEPLVGWTEIVLNLHKNNSAGAGEAFNWLLSRINKTPQNISNMGFVALILGDNIQARELYLSARPGWLEPDQWPELIHTDRSHSCIVAWTLINTGDGKLGQQLLQQSMLYFDETLPSMTEHPDLYHRVVCYLTAGDAEKALQSIETQLAHNHLYDWVINHQLPMYDLIRHEPRYQAALAERKRLIKIQRDTIAAMDVEAGS